VKRSFGFATFGAPIVLVMTLAACGDDGGAAPGTQVEIRPSSYVTTPTTLVPPSTAPGVPAGEPGDTSPQEQVHVVQPGEFLSGIAADYEVDMEDIAEYNNWADGTSHSLFPDDQVRIPPGAMIPVPEEESDETETTEEDDSGDSQDADDEATETTEDDPELCPDGERQGTYTIAAGDIPARVAQALNVTVDQLNDANQNTPGYRNFVVGAEINVPCGSESTETTEE
jgi:LysM repeat protein